MARIACVILNDDIDGSKASETVSFSLDGKHYTIDLNAENARALRGGMAKYILSARPAPSAAKSPRHRRQNVPSSAGILSSEVRAWAHARGLPLGKRGRIPLGIFRAYQAAHTAR